MKPVTGTSKQTAILAAAIALLAGNLQAAVTFTLTPSTISNTFGGNITLNIAGLTSGAKVTVQKFLDANTNNIIDATDWLVQQFPLTDGQASVIGGITNINVPGDHDAVAGTITSPLNVQASGISQRFVGRYAFKLSSPTGQFAPITNFLTISNTAYAQSFTGSVLCSGTNVPNAVVLLFPGQAANASPTAGLVANNAGSFMLKAVPATHSLLAFKPGFVTDATTSPVITLNAGATVTTNLNLLPATRTISGRFVDAANPALGVGGVLVVCESVDYRLAIGFTDTNGNFSVPVTASQWRISLDSEGLPVTGYVGLQSRSRVDTTTGSVAAVTVAFPKGTALIYGSFKDDQNRPLAGVSLWAEDTLGQYEGGGATDQNGNYAAAVLPGTWHVGPDNSSPALANYVVSQGSDLTLVQGQAVQQNFRAIPATNHISGYVKDVSNNPVAGVGVYAYANIGGTYYNQYSPTDDSGYYVLKVANGDWHVNVNCSGDEESLESHGYQCVSEQTTTVANSDRVVNFTVQPCSVLAVITPSPLPTAQQGGYYYFQLAASGCGAPFNWSLAPGSASLPDGLNLWADGTLQGTPNVGGTFSFTVRVANQNGEWADRAFSLTVNSSVPLQVTTSGLPNITRGKLYSQQLGASGGLQPYSWSLALGSDGLPPGLTLSAGGQISGTPTSVGQFNFVVQVTDASFTSATRPLGIRVYPPPTLSLPSRPAAGQFRFQVTGGAGQNYTIEVSTDLSTWSFVQVTNAPSDSFTILLGGQVSSRAFYRLLVGP